MGWALLAILGVATMGILLAMGVARSVWSFVGAALMLGAIGYALQGRPGLPGDPVQADATPIETDPGLIALRGAMFGRFTRDDAYLNTSDAMTRSGSPDLAAKILIGGLRQAPKSVALWTELGGVLATHDGGVVSPASLFAFQQAIRLSSRHPAPPFFLGLAYIRAGELARARPYWARALALTPEGNSYRPDIAVRLALLDRYLALMAQQPAQ